MGNARGGQHRSKIFEGVDKILREREPHGGIGSYQFSVLKEVRTDVWGSAQYFGPVLESIFSEGDQLLHDERGLGKLLGVQ
jgi:hypothetical protein